MAALWALTAAQPGLGQQPAAGPEEADGRAAVQAAVQLSTVGSATVWTARIPGRVTSLVPWGEGQVALRVVPFPQAAGPAEDDPQSTLWRLDTAGEGSLTPVGQLPAKSAGLLAPPPSSTPPTIFTASPGQLWSIAAAGETSPLFGGPHATLDGLVLAPEGWWALAEVGRLRIFEPGRAEPGPTHRLPVEVERRRYGLQLSSPKVTTLWSGGARAPVFLAAPRAEGKRRLRTVWVDPATGERHESWSRFATGEQLAESSFALVDGQPMLFAVTTDGEKVSVFGKKRFFVFALTGDRTRAGSPPTFRTLTASRMWQPADYAVRDVDDDGRDDLVLLQPEGFAGKKLILEAYLGLGGGRFETRPRRTVVDHSGSWSYGDDLDGDGEPDLAVLDRDLAVFAGVVRRERKAVVEKSANWRLSLDVLLTEGQETPTEDTTVSVSIGSDGTEVEHTTAQPTLQVLPLWGLGRPAGLVVRRQSAGHTELWLARLATGE